MGKKLYEGTNIQNIADAIREKTGSKTTYKTSEMASGVNEVYEAGKIAEQKEFWEVFQQRGTRTQWRYAFQSIVFNDETYNPIYPIKLVTGECANTFYNSPITNSKVPFDISGCGLNNTFRYSHFVTITELLVTENTDINTGFSYTSNLKNITITGVIGKNWNMSASPLSVESMKSIISHLKDFTGTDNEYIRTVTFKSSAFEALEAEGTNSPNGNTWAEYVDDLKWNLTLA